MIGGGIEATIQGDEFAGLGHAQEHLAPGGVVIAGGLQDGVEGTGGRLLAQEVQNGLALRRTDGTGGEAVELRAGIEILVVAPELLTSEYGQTLVRSAQADGRRRHLCLCGWRHGR